MRGVFFFAVAALFAHQAFAANGNLIFSDEFNYTGRPDSTKWEFDVGDNWANEEKQRYTDRLENARVENGELVIEARMDGPTQKPYSSARMRTKGPGFLYGRIEIRAKMPGGQGTWPALWMLPVSPIHPGPGWPDNGEIDIVEHVGRDPDNILGSLHTKDLNWMLGTGVTRYVPLLTAVSDYNVYVFEWTPARITMAVNGIEYLNFENPGRGYGEWPYDQHFYLIMNVALGGGFAGEIDDSIFPRRLSIDYVRVYEMPPVTAKISSR